MAVSRIRQAGSLKPQVKVRELRTGQAEIPLIKRAMELANRPSLYIEERIFEISGRRLYLRCLHEAHL